MALFNKINQTLTRYADDKRGAFSMMWAIGGAVLVGLMGAAVDFAIYYNTEGRAQSVADTVALAAAIYVRDNGEIPSNRDKGFIGDYTSGELGYEFRDWVIDGSDGVSISVVYDTENKQVTVNTEGSTRPFFMQFFDITHLDFEAQSVAKFLETEPLDPASIVLVMDNSGSMFFDDMPHENGIAPTEANIRMDGLKSAANNFMTQLNDLVGPQVENPDVPRVLRTGMITFDHEDRVDAPMKWGVIDERVINDMNPRLGTDSSVPLDRAADWLTGPGSTDEPKVHEDENPNADPLKYLILMTDGRNTVGAPVWQQRDGTQNWRGWVQIDTRQEFSWEVVNAFVPNAGCRVRNGYPLELYEFTYANGSVFSGNTTQRVECRIEREVPVFGWDYRPQTDQPTEPTVQGEWEEGEFDIESNIAARAKCDELHAAGVEIFSIGFALEPGQYETNGWANVVNDEGRRCNFTPYLPTNSFFIPGCGTVPAYDHEDAVKNSNIAAGLLQYCANRDENFITADDTSALEEAFEKIGDTIVKEIIRIDS